MAEVAFSLADDFHGRGTATRMLEQLAAIAAAQGIHRFDAEVMADNRAMLGVFHGAGFAVRRKGASGEVTVSLDITLVGASSSPGSLGVRCWRHRRRRLSRSGDSGRPIGLGGALDAGRPERR